MTSNLKTLINKYVSLIKSKMDTEEFKHLKKTNKTEYENRLSNFVPVFKEEYPILFNMIINSENDNDLTILDMFLDKLDAVDNGSTTLNEARNELGHFLHNRYVAK
jgi:hypothetical protein